MVLTDNLIAYYKCDDTSGTTVTDAVGSFNGTATNAAVNSGATGIINYCNDFTAGSYGCYSNIDLNSSNFTISFWFKVDTVKTPQRLIREGTGGDYGHQIDISVQNVSGKYQVGCAFWGDDLYTTDATGFPCTSWTHIAVTFNTTSKARIIYVNGTAQKNDTSAYSPHSMTGTFKWGYDGTNYADGWLDELGVWNRVLDASEISTLYGSGSPPAYPFSSSKNMQVNIGDVWKEVTDLQVNVGDVWKSVTAAQINIGDVWKTIF